MFGQCLVVDEFELELEDDGDGVDVDDFVDELDVAAWAMAAPPPTRAPESTRAATALVNRFRMVRHLLPRAFLLGV